MNRKLVVSLGLLLVLAAVVGAILAKSVHKTHENFATRAECTANSQFPNFDAVKSQCFKCPPGGYIVDNLSGACVRPCAPMFTPNITLNKCIRCNEEPDDGWENANVLAYKELRDPKNANSGMKDVYKCFKCEDGYKFVKDGDKTGYCVRKDLADPSIMSYKPNANGACNPGYTKVGLECKADKKDATFKDLSNTNNVKPLTSANKIYKP
jgi:hypothetical protein